MRMWWGMWAAAALLVSPMSMASDRVALVIGNASYEVGRLSNPVNDATDVAAALRAQGFDVTLALDQNREDLLRALPAFQAKIRPGGIALVFYAGHAVEVEGQNWLLPVRNEQIRVQSDVPIYSVSAQDLLRKVEEGGARLSVLVLDACRDNPLPALVRGSRGLAPVQGGSSSLVVYATAQGKTAQDGTGRNSPFTAALLEELRDPTLHVRELFDKVGVKVEAATGGAQVPWTSGKSIWPPVYLAGEVPGRIDPQPLPSPVPEPQPSIVIGPETLPGTVFRDRLGSGGEGPAMVVIPAGTFLRGSPDSEADRGSDEGPQRSVSVPAFALGQFEVTRAEFGAFVAANPGFRTDAEKNALGVEGCYAYLGGSEFDWKAGTSWRYPGFAQDEAHPVVCVSWNDAQAYAAWLSRETGEAYRLPSESEQEHTLRAGTTTPYPWGTDPDKGCLTANYADASLKSRLPGWEGSTLSCTDGHVFTSPVGVKQANAFNLHDVSGNVWEWAQDCYASSYALAPTDGRAYEPASCDRRVLRGGSWDGAPAGLRSAFRDWLTPANRTIFNGFRLARTF